MTGTFASRAFLMRLAIFGSDETHDGRGSQTVLVMSSTRSAAPFTGTSTATAAGMVGIGEVGAGVGAAVVMGKPEVDAVDGDGAAAGWVQPGSVSMWTSGSASLLITFPPAERRNGITKRTCGERARTTSSAASRASGSCRGSIQTLWPAR